MPVRKTIPEKDGVYFITFTCARWLSLFKLTNSYNVVYKWFDVLKKAGHYIIGYAIMPNHVHAIIAFRNTDKSIDFSAMSVCRAMSRATTLRATERRSPCNSPSMLSSIVQVSSLKNGNLAQD